MSTAKEPYDVARLSSARVSSLLALGLSARRRAATPDASKGQLGLLLADLETAIPASDAGPLALDRLVPLEPQQAAALAGMSYLEALTAETTSQAALEALLALGDLLAEERFPPSTRLTGAVIRALAAAHLLARFEISVPGLQRDQCRALLATLLDVSELPPAVRQSVTRLANQL